MQCAFLCNQLLGQVAADPTLKFGANEIHICKLYLEINFYLEYRRQWIRHMVWELKICFFFPSSLKDLVKAALEGSQLPSVMDFRKFSRNYQLSKSVSLPSLDPVSAKIEANLIFDSDNYIPKESMLKTTLSVFGFAPADLFEVCMSLRSHRFSRPF